ncbi:MAG: sialidase family protein [Planctomycetota bacterium]
MLRSTRSIVSAAVVLLLTAVAAAAEPVDVASGKQPQLAVAPDGSTIHLVYGRGESVYTRSSADAGATWSDEVKVGDVPSLCCGMRRGPRIAATKDAVLVTAIGQITGPDEGGNVLCFRSTDKGKTFGAGVKLNKEQGSAREGMHDLAASSAGNVMVVWLDLRNDDKTELWCATSTDSGEKFDDDKQLYQSPGGFICQCCAPACSFDGKGNAWVMFRNVIDGKRDMYVLKSRDMKRWGRAGKLGNGSWPLQQCPMDGGMIVGLPGGDALTVWRRANTIYSDEPGKPEQELGGGQDCYGGVGPDGAYFVWLKGRQDAPLMYKSPDKPAVEVARGATSPVVVAVGSKSSPKPVIAFQAGEKIRVLRLDAPAAGDGDGDGDGGSGG